VGGVEQAVRLGRTHRHEGQRGEQEQRVEAAQRTGEGIARGELAVANGRDYAGGLQPTRRIVGRVDRDLSETLFRYPIGEEGNGLARHGRRRIFGRHRPDRALSDRAASGQNNRHSGEEPRQGAARQRVGWSGHDATITT
jgi:hypothetical protein